VTGVVWVPVIELRHDEFESVQHIEIGTGIEIGRSQSSGGMKDDQVAYAARRGRFAMK